MERKLDRYRMKVYDKQFALDFVSIVEDPAIEVKGMAFANQKKFEFNDLKQIIAGPAMIPDKVIYRYDKETDYEYEVYFTKEDIEQIVEIFNASVKENKINVDHKVVSPNSFIKSNWIIEDTDNDKSNMYGYQLPVGTWFIEVKVKDREEFLKYKEEGKTSFSVEGVFNMLRIDMKNINKNKQIKTKFMKAKLIDGTEISVSTDVLEVGASVILVEADVKPEAGEIVLETGEILVIDADGVITEIKPKAEDMKDEDKVEDKPKDEVKENKFVITPEDITMIFETLKPMIAEMIASAIGTETDVEEEMSKKVKEVEAKFEKQIEALTETIKSTPAAESFTKGDTKVEVKSEDKFSNTVTKIKNFGK